jgi:ubiquinone/menaquinone biosynthesis C-methylase UbiE
MRTHEQTVHSQFDSRSSDYLTSAVHASGPDLERAKALVAQVAAPAARGLDIGCGAGHLSFALAPFHRQLLALDPSPGMLATVAEAAAARHLPQIQTCLGSAQSLPFADGSFQLVATRYSAHHWRQLEVAVGELARVLVPGGYGLVIDTLGQEDPLVDTYLQSIELLRDISHVRNRSQAQWRGLLHGAGLVELDRAQWPTRLQFSSWIQRMHTPAERVTAIRALQDGAPREVREALSIEGDGSFVIETGLFWLRKRT